MTVPPVPHVRPLVDEVAAHEDTSLPIAIPSARRPVWRQVLTVCANTVGAASAAVFAYSSVHFYLESHRPIGIVFALQQSLVAVAYLIRRPARRVTHRLDDWCLAFVGTFIGVLLRPDGEHAAWGIWAGTLLQLVGAAVVVACLVSLGRSFGFAAGDRGVVTRGPYTVVRHPMYAAYVLLASGYLLQSLSWPNAAIVVIGTLCNCGRALAEERLLSANPDYQVYRRRVVRRIVPGIW
jgi:protein-S-isoprenylcysteine O-methyltransferase Ste14